MHVAWGSFCAPRIKTYLGTFLFCSATYKSIMTLTTLQIAGISVLPAAGAGVVAGSVLYGAYSWRSVTKAWWLDSLVWTGFLLLYFLLSFGFMKLDEQVHFVPQPSASTAFPVTTTASTSALDENATKLTIAGYSLIPAGLSALACGTALFFLSTRRDVLGIAGVYMATLVNYLVTFFGLSVAIMLVDFNSSKRHDARGASVSACI